MSIRIEFEEEKRPIKAVYFWESPGVRPSCVGVNEDGSIYLDLGDCEECSKHDLYDLRDACNAILGEEK